MDWLFRNTQSILSSTISLCIWKADRKTAFYSFHSLHLTSDKGLLLHIYEVCVGSSVHVNQQTVRHSFTRERRNYSRYIHNIIRFFYLAKWIFTVLSQKGYFRSVWSFTGFPFHTINHVCSLCLDVDTDASVGGNLTVASHFVVV